MADAARFHHGRHAGLLVPLFSIPGSRSWGVGEIADLPLLARWIESAGLDFVQLLPVSEMEEGQSSPYAALSAMAIDPVFISPSQVPELVEIGGVAVLAAADRELIENAQAATAVDYRSVRAVKSRALQLSFARFQDRHHASQSPRGRSFRAFADRERWWLDDYALFRALHEESQGRYWRDWEPALRDRDPQALAEARVRLADRILYWEYLQWLADDQWRQARLDAGGVGIFGDFPFMVSGHSADVWARHGEFDVDASVGTPPDTFSDLGQDWGLPVYRWEVMARGDDDWLRQRIRRSVELYDGFRIDHLIGFYRTFVRERSGRSYFTPADEPSQLAQGERLMRIFAESGARIIAEDLGSVPEFVRDSLDRLGIPGLKVLRWEREWQAPGQPFRLPEHYPSQSVAITGTHDTETLAEWWDAADAGERQLCTALPGLAAAGAPEARFSPAIRDALVRALFGAGSDLVILPIQDVFGWRHRINVPGVVSEANWSWRLPWLVDTLAAQPEALERASFLNALARESTRLQP